MYIVIERGCTDASWVIRVLENGDTEILELSEDFYGEPEEEVELDGENWFWNEWCDKESFERVWLNDEQENGEDVTITPFEELEDAFNFWRSINGR
ncbi:MAG: hypothetical protein K0U78_14900 [Actinomycetia bacterium]|nr:hypothetical protein [Actinomycetes bacterium]